MFSQEILQKASGKLKSSVQGKQKVGNPGIKVKGDEVRAVPNTTQKTGVVAVQEDHAKVFAIVCYIY